MLATLTFTAIAHWSASASALAAPWLKGVWTTVWQSSIFILGVWLICRALPKLPATVRCCLWWLACLKLLIGLVWTTPVDLPVLHAAPQQIRAASQSATPAALTALKPIRPVNVGEAASSSAARTQAMPPQQPNRAFPRASGPVIAMRIPWAILLVAAWLLGVAWRMAAFANQFSDSRRLRLSARRIDGNWVRETGERMARRMHLDFIPHIYASSFIASPVVVGMIEPVILIPERDIYEFDNSTLKLALAHEMAHVRRNDLWLGLVPSLAQAFFFFHPLAWLASREYALCREEACDAEAIRLTGIAPADYGKLLLHFGVAGRASSAVIGLGATTNARLLKRRIEMLAHAGRLPAPLAALCLAVALTIGCVGLLPLRLVAQQAPVPKPPASPIPPPEPAVPPQPVQPAQPLTPPEPVAPISALPPAVTAHAAAPVQSIPPMPVKTFSSRKPKHSAVKPRKTSSSSNGLHVEWNAQWIASSKPHKTSSTVDSSMTDPQSDYAKMGMEISREVTQEVQQTLAQVNIQDEINKAMAANGAENQVERQKVMNEVHHAMGANIDAEQLAANARRMAAQGMQAGVTALQQQVAELDRRIAADQSKQSSANNNAGQLQSRVNALVQERDALANALISEHDPSVQSALQRKIQRLSAQIGNLRWSENGAQADDPNRTEDLQTMQLQRDALNKALTELQKSIDQMQARHARPAHVRGSALPVTPTSLNNDMPVAGFQMTTKLQDDNSFDPVQFVRNSKGQVAAILIVISQPERSNAATSDTVWTADCASAMQS